MSHPMDSYVVTSMRKDHPTSTKYFNDQEILDITHSYSNRAWEVADEVVKRIKARGRV